LRHAKKLLAIRKAVLADDWESVFGTCQSWREELRIGSGTDDDSDLEEEQLANKADGNSLYYVLELQLAWEEANRRVIVDSLTRAISSCGVEGEPGNLSTQHVSVAQLSKAIARALELGTKTGDAQQLLLAANTVRQIRNGILSGVEHGGGGGNVDCGMVRSALKTCQEEGMDKIPAVAHREILLIQAELEDQDAAKTLTAALKSESAGANPAENEDPIEEETMVFPSPLEVEALVQAIARTPKERCHTVFTQALLKLSHLMRDLRSAVLESAWDDAHRCVQVLDTINGQVTQVDAPVSTQAHQSQQWRAALLHVQVEVERTRDLITNAKTVTLLREAMLSGQALGRLGHLRLDRLRVDKLDSALAHAVDFGCKTEEASSLYRTARLLRQLRAAILDNDFVTASVVMSEAKSLAVSFTLAPGSPTNEGTNGDAPQSPRKSSLYRRLPVAGAEFEILAHEIDNKLVCRALQTALNAGAVTGKLLMG
jgi:hypothetical protein